MNYKQWVKNNFPGLFSVLKNLKRVLEIVKGKWTIKYLGNYLEYRSAIKNLRVYYGPLYHASDVNPERKSVMESFIKNEVSHKLKLLEVGSWQGASAIIWGRAIKQAGGKVFCIDHFDVWESMPKKYWEFLASGKTRDLFLHNIKSAGLKDTVLPLICKSGDILPILRKESFDVVYIDGNHSYRGCIEDINNCIPLVKTGGVICGDDLDLQLNQVDPDFAKANKDIDSTVVDKKSSLIYHPGVTLAVHEVFGQVSVKNTFWAMRKDPSGWKPVNL